MTRICNVEEKLVKEKRLLRLITGLVISYILVWLPYHATRIYMFFVPPQIWACSKLVFGI